MRIAMKLFGFAVLFSSLGGCGALTFTVGVSASEQELQEKAVETEGGATSKVAMIDVSGLIMNARKSGLLREGQNPVSEFREKLDKAAGDSDVKAVLLRINSPGGTVTATDIMYRELNRFKKKTGKPVVVMMMDVAASGGFYLSCAGDYVVAYPSTVTGSIGVIIQTVSFKPAMDRLGIHAEALTSGKNKAAGSPFGNMTDSHRSILQGLVDDFYGKFSKVVRDAKPNIPADKFADVTDGRVFSGTDAKELGLVDQVGDLYDAFDEAKRRANLSKAKLVLYHRPLSYVASPYSTSPMGEADRRTASAVGTQINLLQLNLNELPGASTAGFYYLWQPSVN